MIVNFTVHGEPQGKARPRFTKTGRAYTPKKTAVYEDSIRRAYSGPEFAGNVDVCILAYFGIPVSYSRAKKTDCLIGKIRPTKKPDCDNIVKAVLDALNGVAYHDDSQVVACTVEKHYLKDARIEVLVMGDEHASD